MVVENRGRIRRAQAGKPTRSRLDALPLAPSQRALLKRGEFGIERGAFPTGTVNFVEAGRNQLVPVLFDQLYERLGVQFASRNPQARGELFGRAKNTIRDGNGCFHASSITKVIPESIHFRRTTFTDEL